MWRPRKIMKIKENNFLQIKKEIMIKIIEFDQNNLNKKKEF